MTLKNIALYLSFCIVVLLQSCLSDDLAFDVIESPVLALFTNPSSTDSMMTISATFYELDKTGILDNAIGIDSIPIGGMSVQVFTDVDVLLGELTTGSDGGAVFSKPWSELSSVSRLEWVGTYDGVPFRIYKNF